VPYVAVGSQHACARWPSAGPSHRIACCRTRCMPPVGERYRPAVASSQPLDVRCAPRLCLRFGCEHCTAADRRLTAALRSTVTCPHARVARSVPRGMQARALVSVGTTGHRDAACGAARVCGVVHQGKGRGRHGPLRLPVL
jgi:hypothetical protein